MPKEKFGGRIKEVAIGATKDQGGTWCARLVAGGSNGLPFLKFESEMPHMPLVAMDVVDTVRMVADRLQESMGAVVKDPVEWARSASPNGALTCAS